MYIEQNTYFYSKNLDITIGNLNTLSTHKTFPISNGGKIVLDGTFQFLNNSETNFIDGTIHVFGSNEQIIPIGDSGIYAPIKVKPSFLIGIEACYFNESPIQFFSNDLNQEINYIANNEFWVIEGADTKLTLSWRSSSGLSSINPENLTIVGYKNNEWQKIDSIIDENSIYYGLNDITQKGSITTVDLITLNEYEAFTFAEKKHSNNNFTINSYIKNNELKIMSSEKIKRIEVFDISGKLIIEDEINSLNTYTTPFYYSSGIYIVKIYLHSSDIVSKKLINN